MSIFLSSDRFRTAINVLGDSYGAGIVAHLSRKDLEESDENPDKLAIEDDNISEKKDSHRGGINGVTVVGEENEKFHNTVF